MATTDRSDLQKRYRLNNTDRGILGLLREDSRMQISEIAARLGVSRTTIRNRIDLLCERNVIKRFTIELDSEHAESNTPSCAFFFLKLNRLPCKFVYEKVRRWPELIQAWSLSGYNDMLLQVKAFNNVRIEDLRTLLNHDPDIQSVETIMVLSEWIKRPQDDDSISAVDLRAYENLV